MVLAFLFDSILQWIFPPAEKNPVPVNFRVSADTIARMQEAGLNVHLTYSSPTVLNNPTLYPPPPALQVGMQTQHDAFLWIQAAWLANRDWLQADPDRIYWRTRVLGKRRRGRYEEGDAGIDLLDTRLSKRPKN